MTEEKLQKGQELLLRLSELRNQKSKWERAERINYLEARCESSYRKDYRLDFEYINFEELKILVLARIQKEIEKVQEEFNAL